MGRSGGAVAAIDVLALDRGGAHLPARLTAATATPERAWPDAISAAVFQQALADLTAAYRNIFASVAGRRKTPRPAGGPCGTGPTAHITASTGTITILLSHCKWPDRPRPL